MCVPKVHARTSDPFTLSCARGTKSKWRFDSGFFIQYRIPDPKKLSEYLGTHVTTVADRSLIYIFLAYGVDLDGLLIMFVLVWNINQAV